MIEKRSRADADRQTVRIQLFKLTSKRSTTTTAIGLDPLRHTYILDVEIRIVHLQSGAQTAGTESISTSSLYHLKGTHSECRNQQRASLPRVSGSSVTHIQRRTASAAAARLQTSRNDLPLPVSEVTPDDLPIIPHDITPVRVEPKVEGLEVSWPSADSHISLYPWSWLQHNSYDPIIHKTNTANESILWGARIEQSPPTVSYEEVMHENDKGLFKWLSNINKFGFSLVQGIPVTPEDTQKLVERIGFIRQTHCTFSEHFFGLNPQKSADGGFWDFTADLAMGDLAYTNVALAAHTDTTYFVISFDPLLFLSLSDFEQTDPCGLQLFHLLSHTNGSGGASLLVDGFYAASILKDVHPEAYEVLSKVRIASHAAGEPSVTYQPYPLTGYPVLGHDPVTGELIQVRWNNDDRSVMSHLDPHLVDEWFQSFLFPKFDNPSNYIRNIVFDNYRVLHGRSAFTGKRRMCGAYVGGDEYRSKLAVLTEKFTPDAVLRATNDIPLTVANGRNIWNSAL
ncbi:hypothetical protein C0989_001969 [Termitomyces sp. Mn162]|nr:hypothetical protein C0989_001969 [Termitomyces sp. Mn162]